MMKIKMHCLLKIMNFFILYTFVFSGINSCKNSPADLKKYFSFLGSSGGSDNPKVFSATPSNGNTNLPRSQSISILFDRPMNMNTCIQAMSIQPTVKGFYTTTDTTLVFTPSSQLDFGTYVYTITKFCEDKSGHDLKDVFSVNFSVGSTANAGTIPTVSSILVPSGTLANCLAGLGTNTDILTNTVTTGCLGNPTFSPVIFNFSQAMDTAATQNAIGFSPSLSGFYVWSNGNQTLTFTPSTKLPYGTTYTVVIGAGAKSAINLAVNSAISSTFTAGGLISTPTVSSILVPSGTLATCLAGLGTNTDILTNTVTTGCLGNPTLSPIVINFSQAMDAATTQNAIGFSPSLTGFYVWSNGNQTLAFTPSIKLTYGTTYTVAVGAGAKSAVTIPVNSAISSTFTAGNLITTPQVQAFGVATQVALCSSFPGTGFNTVSDPQPFTWSSPLQKCFWDNTQPVLTASTYQFTGGDTGTGFAGSTNDCADQASDNFVIIFNTYMDTNATLAATSLKRLSPPLTSIALASATWVDCQSVAPFGCRILTVAYAEQEASCNGNQFGNIATGGDFNLLKTTPAVANYPLYQLSVGSAAKDVNGLSLSAFSFSMIGQ